MKPNQEELLLQAANDFAEGFYSDALSVFLKLLENDVEKRYEDDIVFDIGLCYLKMNQYDHAMQYFDRVVIDYPDSDIDRLHDNNEVGKTAAKALLGLVEVSLIVGNIEDAKKYKDLIKNKYPESYVKDTSGKKIYYYQIASSLLDRVVEKKTQGI